MKKTLLFPFIVGVLSLTGCIPQPDQVNAQITTQIRYSAYLGKTIPLFILGNGTPYNKQILSDGSKRYAWNSGSNKPYRYNTLPGEWEEDDWMYGECEIQMLTNPKGYITAIYAYTNRRKNWDATRCRDYLK